jgi:hypothetical protein
VVRLLTGPYTAKALYGALHTALFLRQALISAMPLYQRCSGIVTVAQTFEILCARATMFFIARKVNTLTSGIGVDLLQVFMKSPVQTQQSPILAGGHYGCG